MCNKNLEYIIFRNNVTARDLAIVSCKINDSKNFELDELNHVIIKGTNNKMGYLGDDTLELINPHKNKKEFTEYYNKLKGIFRYVSNN